MEQVARRAVDALPNITGTVLVRDRCGRADLVDAVLAECRARGLDPIVEHVSSEQLRAIIGATPLAALERWDLDRAEQAESVNGLIVLGGWLADLDGLPENSVAAWAAAIRRLELELERRNVPTVVVAVPTEYVAQRLGIGLPELEACVLPALLLSADALHEQVAPLVSALERGTRIQVVTDAGTLALDRGRRPLMIDDGVIDDADVASGAVVSNLPAGSIYCTVIEAAGRG